MTVSRIPPNPEQPAAESDFEGWRQAFRTQRKLVQAGITARLSRVERLATLRQAIEALPDLQAGDEGALEIIADDLEAKLREMVDVIYGSARGSLIYTARPPTINTEALPEDLLEDYWRDERRWLFVCGAQDILHDYRDHGRHLLLKMREDLLQGLADGVAQVSGTIAALNGHLMVEHCLDDSQHAEIASALAGIRGAQALYQEVLTTSGGDGLTGILDKNWYRVRNQFTVACSLLSLRLYGHITTDALERLLALKSVSYLDRSSDDYHLGEVPESERKHNERNRVRAVAALMSSANRSKWPIWPILQLYRYNERYGRRSAVEVRRGNS